MPSTTAHPIPNASWVGWYRTIAEHLEGRRLDWHEHTLLTWLGGRADPKTAVVRTSRYILAEQTGLSADRIATLCRRLQAKGYLADRTSPARRRGLRELVVILRRPDGVDRTGPAGRA